MRCRNRMTTGQTKVIENGDRKRSAFGRIGACTEFIEKNEHALIGNFSYANNFSHMRGESRQVLLDALLIADIDLNALKPRNLRG
jgi:hypothetical protein